MARKKAPETSVIKGWAAIAKYLGMTPASAQRWAKEGMPVKREGRNTVADPIELQSLVGAGISHGETSACDDGR
jgi:hypothetical protein